MSNDDVSLDELIDLINSSIEPQRPPPPIPMQTASTEPINFRTLTFKPWSGNIGGIDIIPDETEQQFRQQSVEAEEDQSQDPHQEAPPELDILPKKTEGQPPIQDINSDKVGYFYKFQACGVRLIKYLLEENGFSQCGRDSSWTIYWSSTIVRQEVYQGLLPYQKINHFPSSFHLTRKDLMNKCIGKMAERFPTHYNFLPRTFILPQQIDQLIKDMGQSQRTYIVKPHNRSQGKGITVTSSLQVVRTKLQKYSSLVVSHYVGNPLLVNRLKFDLRIYVAITGVNPLRIYVYEQGLARFATEFYDPTATESESKKFQHLTNYSINKKNTEFQSSDKQEYFGSKWALTALKEFLAFNLGRPQTQQLWERIDELIVKTIIAGQSTLFSAFMGAVPYWNGCFEVLGFDVLIDAGLKPWLMEVNMSPSMNTDSSLDLRIKGGMIASLFTLAGVMPTHSRYIDGSHLRLSTANFVRNDKVKVEPNDLICRFVIKEIEQEDSRKGQWRRVFPVANHKYGTLFETDRYFNRLVRENLNKASQNSLHKRPQPTVNLSQRTKGK